MKRMALVLALLACAAPAWSEGDELDDLAKKQRAAMYPVGEQDIRRFVMEFTASAWKSVERLENAKLVIATGAGVMTEGLPPSAEEDARGVMEAALKKARLYLEAPLAPVTRLKELGPTTIRVQGTLTEIVAVPEPGSSRPNAPTRARVVLDEHGRLQRVEQDFEDEDAKVVSDFTWNQVGEQWIPTGYTETRGETETVVTLTWQEVRGFTLPARIEASREGHPTRAYTFVFRTVVHLDEAEGPFGTPERTTWTFVRACASRDAGRIARCFAENAEKELQPIRQGRLTADQLDELKAMFGASEVLGVAVAEDGLSVTVVVTAMRGDEESEEELTLVLDDDYTWRILGL